jgi:hypothetical protein
LRVKTQTDSLLVVYIIGQHVIVDAVVDPQGEQPAVGVGVFGKSLHQFETVQKVRGHVVVLLQEQNQSVVLSQHLYFLENEVRLPPPVVLDLDARGVPEVPEGVGEMEVWTGPREVSGI